LRIKVRSFGYFRAVLLFILLLNATLISFGLQSGVTVPSNGSIYYPSEAKLVLNDGFETGDFRAWNGTYITAGGTATVDDAGSYEGTYHSHFRTNDSIPEVNYAYCYEDLSSSVTEVYARGYFKIAEGLPLDNNDERFGLVGFEVNGHLQATFRVYRYGGVDNFNIVGLNGTAGIAKSAESIYPSLGQWYCIEFYVRMHDSSGEYRAWVNGIEQIAITNVDTTIYGSSVTCVRFGLTYTANVDHSVDVYCDSAVISTRPIGLLYTFAVIGNETAIPAIRNFYWLFGNQSIIYRILEPAKAGGASDIALFDGIVVWTLDGGYNASAVREYARNKVVISHMGDFCRFLYPALNSSMEIVAASTVNYTRDWGNFRSGDVVEMHNMTSNVNKLLTVTDSGVSGFSNVSSVTRYNSTRIATFYMNGTNAKSGFFVMDLDATTPGTDYDGIWHTFPAVKMVKDFPTGRYARWFANGVEHWTYDQVMAWLSNWVAQAPKGMNVSLLRIGKSALGRDINATRFGNGTRYCVIDAALHGEEKNPTLSVLRLLEVIQNDFDGNGYWKRRLNEISVIVIPIMNPDGYISGSRYNGHGIDLNRQFPPQNTTEPEVWALRWLWGNYSTFVYVNLHEGRHWQPLDYYYSINYTTINVEVTGFSKQNIYWTANDFEILNHWGYYTEGTWSTNPVPIGQVRLFSQHAGSGGQANLGASYLYNISSYLVESFVWSSDYNGTNHKARQILWAMDYYVATALGLTSHIDRLRGDDFLVVTQGKIKSLTWTDRLRLEIDPSDSANIANGTTKIDVGDRPKPSLVVVDGNAQAAGKDWIWYSGVVTITSAKAEIEIIW